MKTFKIKILAHVVAGGKFCKPGDIVEVNHSDANYLVYARRAEFVPEKKEEQPAAETKPGKK